MPGDQPVAQLLDRYAITRLLRRDASSGGSLGPVTRWCWLQRCRVLLPRPPDNVGSRRPQLYHRLSGRRHDSRELAGERRDRHHHPTQFSCGASGIIWGTALLHWGLDLYVYGWQSLERAERPPVGQDSLLHLREGRSYPVILLLRERCGQVLREPVEMLADDPADLLVARGPVPRGRWRSAGRARHARQRRHAECLVLVSEQPGPGSQVGEQLVEHRVEGVCLGDPSVGLLHVQDRVNDLAEHLVKSGERIVAPGQAHASTDAARRPSHTQG